jgi:hypothetical protein
MKKKTCGKPHFSKLSNKIGPGKKEKDIRRDEIFGLSLITK